MSYHGASCPPPLPPRSPRPAGNESPHSGSYPNWNYLPPPSGPPPQSPGYLPDPQPPPIPPRPPGYEIVAAQQSSTQQPILSFPIPPPPPGPPPVTATSTSTSYPAHPYTPSQSQDYRYSYIPPTSPGVQDYHGLTTIPPPPPGPPPPNNSSLSPYNPASFQQYQHVPQKPVISHDSQPSTDMPATYTPNYVPHATPNAAPIPPPTSYASPLYTPPEEAPCNQAPETSYHTLTSNPQSPNHGSHFTHPPVTPTSPEDLEARFQSLSVENPPVPSPQPTTSYQGVSAQRPNSNHLQNASPPAIQTPQSGYQSYERPTEIYPDTRYSARINPPAPAPPAVTSCIDTPMAFATTWYWHPKASEFHICSRCYVDHIHGTRFQNSFQSKKFDDGGARICRFSKPRMKDHLFKAALSSGSLDLALDWMRSRLQIPDCKGTDGVKGSAGVKWYRAKSNAIPGFVTCEACYEDLILTSQLSTNFEPTHPHPVGETWSCDVAVPFVEKEFEARSKLNDWTGFANEAKARLSIPACPGRKALTYDKKWFIPKGGPNGLVFCAGCYCDKVIHSGEEKNWEVAESYTRSADKYVQCGMSIFSIKMAMASAQDSKNFSIFWTAVHKLSHEKFCEDDGIEDGIWYTLPSDPKNFGICAGCFVAIAEPLNIAQFFRRKGDAQPAGTKWRCCFSVANPRFGQYIKQLLQLYYTLDPTPFDNFASVYSSVPTCPRDEDAKNRRWFGWLDCTICPECHHGFARHTELAAKMDLNDTLLENSVMCEMYSPRMRNLYKECSEASPPEPVPLLTYSAQRRLVWAETVPQMKMMLFRAKMALKQQRMLNITSSYYNMAGMMQESTYGSSYSYGAAGVGYGYANMNLLQGAMYSQQAQNVSASVTNGSAVFVIGQLEQRWRAVE
ncbi:uncharacterized protein F4822DRAFT_274985 [Hypoxylon trugodes]|uniref:uncharacterized protein n=1 Tax=Hypoxylon trugodes TaxID=326681 RepID=UPI0021945EE2|nr:uncharacterized protein F4822DRAFT_274985 [Hypoxylon trugodes]KAI1387132.1 hypothetical protein F4822DRAFT_274985 [Hypoxylon trugodes]